MESDIEEYLVALAVALRRSGASSEQTSEAIAEVERQISGSGQDPRETFGPPEAYAERVLSRKEQHGDSSWEWRTFRATAFDEMDVLRDAGQQGWELVDVGFYALHCRRPRGRADLQRWEYRRRVGGDRRNVLETMTDLGWEPCGTWMPFHYFKRRLGQDSQATPASAVEGTA